MVPLAEDTHPLDQSWPEFLNWLDSDPGKALERFYLDAWSLLSTRPPRTFSSFSSMEREELISQVIAHCCDDDFRRLRQYRDRGRRLSGWLTVVAHREALNELRRLGRFEDKEELPEISVPPDPDPLPARLTRVVRDCLAQLSDKCQALLAGQADGMKPREMVGFLGLPEHMNKKVSDDLGYCRERLKTLLMAEGVGPEVLA